MRTSTILCGFILVGNRRKHRQLVRRAAPVSVKRNRALFSRSSSVARKNGCMYHICAAQCQTQFLFGKKFVGHDLRASGMGGCASCLRDLAQAIFRRFVGMQNQKRRAAAH